MAKPGSEIGEQGGVSLKEANKRTAGASSARRVLELLLSFSERRPRATVAELSELSGAPIATTYRHVALLKELRLLEEGPDNHYHLTSQVMPLARAAQMVNDHARLARPTMVVASEELGETVMLLQPAGETAVCVERVECDRPMRFTFEPGHSLPLGYGASGKMLLACLPEKARSALLERVDTAARVELLEELALARERGYALSSSEIDEGVWACSVPVVDSGSSSAVLTVAGPQVRMRPEHRETVRERLQEHAKEIRQRISTFSL